MSDQERNIQWALPSPRRIFTPAVTAIIVLMIIGFVLFTYAQGFAADQLMLSSQGILQGKIWQLVTYPFVNTGCTLMFNGMLMLFFGSSAERVWRTKAFVLFMLVVAVTCGLLWVIVSLIVGQVYLGLGMGACGYGLLAAFGVMNYRRRVFAMLWTVEAHYIAWFLIAIGIILGIAQPITWIWVSGAAVGYVYIKLRMRQSPMPIKRRGRVVEQRGGGFVDID